MFPECQDNGEQNDRQHKSHSVSTCKELSEDKRPPTPTALLDNDEYLPGWRDGRAPRDAGRPRDE